MTRFAAIAAVVVQGCIGLGCSDGTPERSSDPESAAMRDVTQGAPTESSGMSTTVRGGVPLATYPDLLGDGELRVREVVLEPGASIAVHVHDSRPAVAYVVEGELVEHRNDSADPVIRRRGDVYFEGPETVHWVENVSPNPVCVISVDIYVDGQE